MISNRICVTRLSASSQFLTYSTRLRYFRQQYKCIRNFRFVQCRQPQNVVTWCKFKESSASRIIAYIYMGQQGVELLHSSWFLPSHWTALLWPQVVPVGTEISRWRVLKMYLFCCIFSFSFL